MCVCMILEVLNEKDLRKTRTPTAVMLRTAGFGRKLDDFEF